MSSNLVLQGGVAKTEFQNQWTYRLTVVLENGQSIVISYPLTIQFNIVRDTQASSNTGTFTVYNLAYATREKIFKDALNTGIIKGITFEAGYEGELILLFKGNIQQAYSRRVGSDVLTEIMAWDVSMGNEQLAVTFDTGTSFKDAFKNLVSQSSLTLGSIGNLEGSFKQPTTFIGSPLEVTNELTGGHAFIDNGVINVLQNNECLDAGVVIMNADAGMLGTPIRRNAQVEVECTFRPEIKVGQLLEIQSLIASEFDGSYVVLGIVHDGTISGAVAGTRTTKLNLMNGNMLYNSLTNLTDGQTGQPFTKVKGEDTMPVDDKYGASVEEVYRYIRNNNGKIPNKKINSAITWKDMIGHENTDAERFNELTKDKLNNCKNIANTVYRYIKTNVPNGKYIITSGWRSNRINAKYGGSSSVNGHLYGKCIDLQFTNMNSYNAWRTYFKGYPYYSLYHLQHIHVQSTGTNSEFSR